MMDCRVPTIHAMPAPRVDRCLTVARTMEALAVVMESAKMRSAQSTPSVAISHGIASAQTVRSETLVSGELIAPASAMNVLSGVVPREQVVV